MIKPDASVTLGLSTMVRLTICFFALLLHISAMASQDPCEVAFAELELGKNPELAAENFSQCLKSANVVGNARAEILAAQAMIFTRLKKSDEAALALEEAVKLQEEPDPYTYFQLAELYANMQKFNLAQDTLTRSAAAILKLQERRHKALLAEVELLRNKFRKKNLEQ